MKPRVWVLRLDERPWTFNSLRSAQHWTVNARRTAKWRVAFCALAMEAQIPSDARPVEITVTPFLATRRGLQDSAACVPAAKAAIDGLCDGARWVTMRGTPDDGPGRVVRIIFEAPICGDGDGLEIKITELSE